MARKRGGGGGSSELGRARAPQCIGVHSPFASQSQAYWRPPCLRCLSRSRETFNRWGSVVARGHWSLLGRHHRLRHGKHKSAENIFALASTTSTGASVVEGEARSWNLETPPDRINSASSMGSPSDSDRGWRPASRTVLMFTVSVDAFIDGFLIGLCVASDATTAVIMASATSLVNSNDFVCSWEGILCFSPTQFASIFDGTGGAAHRKWGFSALHTEVSFVVISKMR